MKRAIISVMCFGLLLVLLVIGGIIGFAHIDMQNLSSWLVVAYGVIAFVALLTGSLCLGSVSRDVEMTELERNSEARDRSVT